MHRVDSSLSGRSTVTLTALSDTDRVCRMSNMVFSTVPLQSKCGNLEQVKRSEKKRTEEMNFLGTTLSASMPSLHQYEPKETWHLSILGSPQ